jgi:hypothetical protein
MSSSDNTGEQSTDRTASMEKPVTDSVSSMSEVDMAALTTSLSTLSTSEKETASFHPFPQLPIELRNAISKLAADEPRVVPIMDRRYLAKSDAPTCGSGLPEWDCSHEEFTRKGVPWVFVPPSYMTPHLTLVNHESRLVALKQYPENETGSESSSLRRSLLFRKEKDIMYFPGGDDLECYLCLLWALKRKDLNLGYQCKHIAIDVENIVDPRVSRRQVIMDAENDKDIQFISFRRWDHRESVRIAAHLIEDSLAMWHRRTEDGLESVILIMSEDKSFDEVSQEFSASYLTKRWTEATWYNGEKMISTAPKIEEMTFADFKARFHLPI